QHLAVAHDAIDLAGRMDDELIADIQFAGEGAANLGDVDADLAVEFALFGDADDAAVHGGFNVAFDDQRVAIQDFRALETYVRADDEAVAGARILVRILLRGRSLGRAGGGLLRGSGVEDGMRDVFFPLAERG